MNTHPQMIKANSSYENLESSASSYSQVLQNFRETENHTDHPMYWPSILIQASRTSILLLFPLLLSAVLGITFFSLKPPQRNLSLDNDDHNLNSDLRNFNLSKINE